jgi:hypothetical protein
VYLVGRKHLPKELSDLQIAEMVCGITLKRLLADIAEGHNLVNQEEYNG